MKQILFFLSMTFFIIKMDANCPYTPTIYPTNLILCPNTTDTLWTQTYDSYQWYVGGVPIQGATNQYYVVSSNLDAGSFFSVEVTLNGCKEFADSVLVDGYAFLGVTVATEGKFFVDGLGVAKACEGDTLLLVLNLPYDTQIQWTKNGGPIIGATNDTLVITTSGDYSVSGAPSICPNFIENLGNQIPIEFRKCTLGIDDIDLTLIINYYPNPFSNSITVELNTNIKTDLFLLKDITGKLVERVTVNHAVNKITMGENLPSGIYFIDYQGCRKPLRIVKI